MHFSATAAILLLAHSSFTYAQSSLVPSPPQPSQYALGISAGAVNVSAPDPCGPPIQPLGGPPGSNSTCNKSVSVAALNQPQYYGVQCTSIEGGMQLDTTCVAAATRLCQQISGQVGSQYQQTNKWIWSQDVPEQSGNCTFGVWWPEGGAPPPSLDRCYNQILSPIHDACGASTFNAGSVNLQVFPAFVNGTVSTGLPVDGDYPSYIMVPQQSYCGINVGMDECS